MGQGQPGEGQGQGELGTGFVPASPEVTAQQIAGAQANAAAAQALAAAAAAGQPGQPMPGEGQGQPGQGQAQTPMQGAASSTASKGGAAKSGDSSNNQKPPPGDLSLDPVAEGDSRGEKVDQDAEAAALKFAREPWFAKLPPNLKQAIQGNAARSKAPRGYEERLRRYFESVD
jgi:hypothetical protein